MIAITGANGHLGLRLLQALARRGASVRALVRSRRAAARIEALGLGDAVTVEVVDYLDAQALAVPLQGCGSVVHLVGIIKESAGNRYTDAHEATCTALAEAAEQAGVQRIIYMSILGAAPDSANACLASKGAAERILQDGAVDASVIRVPMVLGEGDYATAALAARARRSFNVVLRGASYEQPIYAGDVIAAIMAGLETTEQRPAYDLAGPESLSRNALTHRAARVLGRRTRVLSLPLTAGLVLAWVAEKLLSNPPVTRAMLGVLDHDDQVNTQPAVAALGLTLTPLDETIRRCIADGTDSS